jgi:hypothetical protein
VGLLGIVGLRVGWRFSILDWAGIYGVLSVAIRSSSSIKVCYVGEYCIMEFSMSTVNLSTHVPFAWRMQRRGVYRLAVLILE